MEISVWNMKMPDWNGIEDFKNGMEDNLPYFYTISSSVARGGLAPPLDWKVLKKTRV